VWRKVKKYSFYAIYTTDFMSAAVSSSDGICVGYQPVSFSKSDNDLVLDMTQIIKDDKQVGSCPGTVDPIKFGYNYFSMGPSWFLRFDMRSCMIALAINMRILNINELQVASSKRIDAMDNFPLNYCNKLDGDCNGLKVMEFNTYIEPRKSLGMRLIYCKIFSLTLFNERCVLIFVNFIQYRH